MKKNIILILIVSFSQVTSSFSQDRIDSNTCVLELDSLQSFFGQNKEIVDSYQLSILKTLSYYPELSDTKIKFKIAHLKTSLTTRPTLLSLLFRRKKKRTYIIRIDDSIDKIRIKDAPFNAKIGVLAHEFSHIVDYSERNTFGVIGRGFSYLSKKKKERFEKSIDRMTINHHLRIQLYDWAFYVLHSLKGTEEYKTFKKEIYLEPEEILREER